jgi:FkbM family methyltransferase
MPEFKEVNFNDKWSVKLPEFLSVMQVDQVKFWEKERLAHMYTAIRPNDVVLDIGSAWGDMSVLYALWGAKVVLVEPSPGFWPLIKNIFDENNVKPSACFPALVSNENIPDPRGLNISEDGLWPCDAYGKIPETTEVGFSHLNEKPHISVMKIDDMGLEHVDVITIDCEGSEFEIIQGAEKTLKKDSPILFVSVHPEFMWREHHHSPDDFHVMLTKMGYDGTYLSFDHEQHYLYKKSRKPM